MFIIEKRKPNAYLQTVGYTTTLVAYEKDGKSAVVEQSFKPDEECIPFLRLTSSVFRVPHSEVKSALSALGVECV